MDRLERVRLVRLIISLPLASATVGRAIGFPLTATRGETSLSAVLSAVPPRPRFFNLMKTGISKSARRGSVQSAPLVQDPNASTSTRRLAPPCDGIVSDKARRNQTDLDVGSSVFGGSALRGLLDEWLVPVIVEGMIRDLICSELVNEEK